MELSEVARGCADERVADAYVLLFLSLSQSPFNPHQKQLELGLAGSTSFAAIIETQLWKLLAFGWRDEEGKVPSYLLLNHAQLLRYGLTSQL